MALYLFTFEVPAHWQRKGIPLAEIALMVEWSRDALLASTFALRAFGEQTRETRSLFGRMAVFFLVYAGAECPYLYYQYADQLRSGTWWDLPWSLAMAVGAVLIATCPYTSIQIVPETTRRQQSPWRRLRVLLRLIPLVFPLVILLMAAHIAEEQFALAVAAVLASFACSSARIVLTEKQERFSARALEERNALLKSVFEGTGEAIYVKDAEGRCLMVNEAVAKFFGKPIDEIIGKTAFQLVDFATARKLTENDREILETGRRVTVDFTIPRDAEARSFLLHEALIWTTTAKSSASSASRARSHSIAPWKSGCGNRKKWKPSARSREAWHTTSTTF